MADLTVALVVHRFPPFIGGVERHAKMLADHLAQNGVRARIFTTRAPGRVPGAHDVFELDTMKLVGPGFFFWPRALAPRTLRAIKSCDVVHAFDISMFAGAYGAFSARATGRPSVLTATYHPPSAMTRQGLKRAYDRIVGATAIRRYDRVIAHSEFELRHIAEAFPRLDLGRVRSVPHPNYLPLATGDAFRAKFNIPPDEKLLLYVGRLDSTKGLPVALGAALRLRKMGERFRFVTIGPQEAWYKLPEEDARGFRDLGDAALATGYLSDELLASAYAAAHVALVTSKYETFGLTIVEALAQGTPVLSTAVGIAPEMLTGENGAVVPSDPEAVAAAVRDAWSDPARHASMRRAAAATGRRFTANDEARATMRIYSDVVRE